MYKREIFQEDQTNQYVQYYTAPSALWFNPISFQGSNWNTLPWVAAGNSKEGCVMLNHTFRVILHLIKTKSARKLKSFTTFIVL